MKITLDQLREKYNAFNMLCFEGKLPSVAFRISNARTLLGYVHRLPDKTSKSPRGKMPRYELVVSTKAEMLDADARDDVMLHEMIHLHILTNGIRDHAPHGKEFRRLMARLNTHYGRHITTSHKATGAEQDRDTQKHKHLLCMLWRKDGSCSLLLPAFTRLLQIRDIVEAFPDVIRCSWYVGYDPYFNRYRRSVGRINLYSVADVPQMLRLLDTARPFVIQGSKIIFPD